MLNDLFQPLHLLILLFLIPVGMAALIVPLWITFRKAGLNPALSLLVVVPFGVFFVLYVLAFSHWRVASERSDRAGAPPQISHTRYDVV